MLRHKLIHPQISAILAAAGHHSTVLIADGNYPAASKRGPRAELISLNLMPGVPTCNQVLEASSVGHPGRSGQYHGNRNQRPLRAGR